MNDVVSHSAHPEDRVRFGDSSPRTSRDAGVTPADYLEYLAHELRQPLSAIESLACYLELTVPEEQVCRHLQRIRAMVFKAHHILEQAVERQ